MQNFHFQETKYPIYEKNEDFFSETLETKVLDYKDRYHWRKTWSEVLSYPLQLVSILAGSYLLWEFATKIIGLSHYETSAIVLFLGCFAVFFFIEGFRRKLIDTIGYHYVASYNPKHEQGEYLRDSLIVVSCISLLLIASGTWGAYQFSLNNAPQQASLDIKQETSPLLKSIQDEKNAIAKLDQSIETLQKNKTTELRDHKSYAVWEGKEYLLPETKIRHEGYDKQIASMQAQREKHLAMLQQQQAKLDKTEQKTEKHNETITARNHETRLNYGLFATPVWFAFEALLLLFLAYKWIYKVGAKRYAYLAHIEREKMAELAKPAKLSPSTHETQQLQAKPTQVSQKKQETHTKKTKVSQETRPYSRFREGAKKLNKLGSMLGAKNKGGRPEKLTSEEKETIKSELKNGVSVRKLSEKYGVSHTTIQKLQTG